MWHLIALLKGSPNQEIKIKKIHCKTCSFKDLLRFLRFSLVQTMSQKNPASNADGFSERQPSFTNSGLKQARKVNTHPALSCERAALTSPCCYNLQRVLRLRTLPFSANCGCHLFSVHSWYLTLISFLLSPICTRVSFCDCCTAFPDAELLTQINPDQAP